MKTCYILVGVPGSGKTTWISAQNFDWDSTTVVSTDNYIEQVAQESGKTYSDVFRDCMPEAVSNMVMDVNLAIENNNTIVWDQTNTTRASRAKKLKMLPAYYKKVAVVFSTPDSEEHARRLSARPGKDIPQSVINIMIRGFEKPSNSEGFDQIINL